MNIDKDIPIPDAWKSPGKQVKYPFAEMEPGDSILSDSYENLYKAARRMKKRNPFFNFMIRREGECSRLWRIPLNTGIKQIDNFLMIKQQVQREDAHG